MLWRPASATYLAIDFTEPRAKLMAEQYLGNCNTAQGVPSLTLEVTITGATTPPLDTLDTLGNM